MTANRNERCDITIEGVQTSSLNQPDECKRLFDQTRTDVAPDAGDDPSHRDGIDTVLTSLTGGKGISKMRDDNPPQTVKHWLQSSGIGLRYPTSFESKWG